MFCPNRFLQSLMQKFAKGEICLISLDNYYKPKNEQLTDANGIANYDTPDSIDFEQFNSDLTELINGNEVQKKEYDFNNPNFFPNTILYKPSPVIVLEGVFLFNNLEIENHIELKIFIETQEHLRLKRRILRDLSERGYPVDETLYYIEHHVTPGYSKYVEPHRNTADIIIPNNRNFNKALELLVCFMQSKF